MVSARRRVNTAFENWNYNDLAIDIQGWVRTLVHPLVQDFRFAIWPLINEQTRPPYSALGVEGLYQRYEQSVMLAGAKILEAFSYEAHTKQERIDRAITAIANGLRGRWALPAKSFLFAPLHLQSDRRDEVWLYESRRAFLALIRREWNANGQ